MNGAGHGRRSLGVVSAVAAAPLLSGGWLKPNQAWHSPLLGQEHDQSLEDWLAQTSPAQQRSAEPPPPQSAPAGWDANPASGPDTTSSRAIMAASKRKMKALVVAKLGDPTGPMESGVLNLEAQHPVPQLPPGSVRIRVVAASLNFADLLQVQGSYQVSLQLPKAMNINIKERSRE